jgi:hypothetical protein
MTIHRVTCRDAGDYGLDEIVAENVSFHIERMAANHFWFQVTDGARRINVHLHQEGRKIVAVVEDGPEHGE